jgi:hypothetical protein
MEGFETDLKFHYNSEFARKQLLERIQESRKIFIDFDKALIEWINILEKVRQFFHDYEGKTKKFLEELFLEHSFIMLKHLRSIKGVRRLQRKYLNESKKPDYSMIKFDSFWKKQAKKYPLIFNKENTLVMGYYLRFIEIKLKKEFKPNVPFKLLIEAIKKLR